MSPRCLLAGLAVFVGTAAHAQLADGSFETQAPVEIGANPGWCYGGGAPPACTGSGTPWQASSTGGFQLDTNTAWPGIATPDGSYYAFVQATGSLSQTFVADASGPFTIDWLAAGRPISGISGGDESYSLTVNGQSLGTFSTASGQPFTEMSSDPFSFTAGSTYTLAFNGLTPFSMGDNTAYFDGIQLVAAVPEPSTWALMLLGFGGIGAAMRRRRLQTRAA